MVSRLERVIAHGNRGHHHLAHEGSKIECADGFSASVIAGGGTYCTPRPALCTCALLVGYSVPVIATWPGFAQHDFPGPYTKVELGFPSARPEPWSEWKLYADDEEGWSTVYGQVPVDMVRALFALHGGESVADG